VSARPRIIAFITSYFPDVGGAEIALRQVADRLAGQFEFHIVASRRRLASPRTEIMNEGRLWRWGIGSPIDKWLLPVVAASGLRRMVAEIGSPALLWGIDITQASLAAAVLRRRNPGLPLVITIQYGETPERLESGRGGLIRRSFRTMLSLADHVTAISTPLLALARDHGYRRPVTLIPNGVDVERFRCRNPRSPSRPPTVVTVGRLVPKNGVDTLLRAVSLLRSDLPGLQCRIVGDGPERARLEALARDLGLGGAARFYGSVSHEAVAQHLWESDVFARPSRSEGMGTAFVEALAAGLPIVGTPVGGIVDVIRDGETGLLTPVDQPADLAEKIRLLLTRREFAASLVHQGAAVVRERFDADRVAERYAQVFRETLRR
jgi:phosphatidylinositol alpha-1,6-mannosyltransferase